MKHTENNSYAAPEITMLEVSAEAGFAASTVRGGVETPGQKPWKFDYSEDEDDLLW